MHFQFHFVWLQFFYKLWRFFTLQHCFSALFKLFYGIQNCDEVQLKSIKRLFYVCVLCVFFFFFFFCFLRAFIYLSTHFNFSFIFLSSINECVLSIRFVVNERKNIYREYEYKAVLNRCFFLFVCHSKFCSCTLWISKNHLIHLKETDTFYEKIVVNQF